MARLRCGRGRILSLVLLGFLLALAGSGRARAQDEGVLAGEVVNGTPGGAEIGADLLVLLHIFQGDTELNTLETTTGADGRFRFEGLDPDPALGYWPEVFYQDVGYSNPEPYRFDAGPATIEARLNVYEVTADDSAIRLDSVHIIAESFDQVLRISEVHIFANEGERTYLGSAEVEGQPASVFLPLPEGAVGLAFEEGAVAERWLQVESGVWDTEPLPPGTEASVAFFSYHLIVDGESVLVEREFAYPVAALNVLVTQPGLTLGSDQLQAEGIESFQGQQYQFFTARTLEADMPLSLEFDVLPGAMADPSASASPVMGSSVTGTATEDNQALLRWLGFGLALVAVGAVVIYALATGQAPAGRQRPVDLGADPRARQVLADLADLEEAYEAGEVERAVYQRRRAEAFRALKSLG